MIKEELSIIGENIFRCWSWRSCSGAVGNGLYEKSLVLDLAKRIESKLRVFENVETKMSRQMIVI